MKNSQFPAVARSSTVLLAAIWLTGCTTTTTSSPARSKAAPAALAPAAAPSAQKGTTIHVTLAANGALVVDGKSVEPANLVKKLKSLGATDQTCIQISIPEGTATSVLTNLTTRLAAGGFRRILFTKPRRADVSIEGAESR